MYARWGHFLRLSALLIAANVLGLSPIAADAKGKPRRRRSTSRKSSFSGCTNTVTTLSRSGSRRPTRPCAISICSKMWRVPASTWVSSLACSGPIPTRPRSSSPTCSRCRRRIRSIVVKAIAYLGYHRVERTARKVQ